MKPTFIVLALVLTCNLIFAQETERKGYLGIMLGPSFPYGQYASTSNSWDGHAKTGMNIHLLTFGYRIGKNLGVAASWYGIANPFTQSGTDGMWGMGAIMAGPLCSFRLNDNTSLEFRGLFGFVLETKQYDSNEISYARGPGTSVGAILRYNIAPRWSLLLNLDTFNTKLDIQPEQDPRISVLNSSVGIAYRLK